MNKWTDGQNVSHVQAVAELFGLTICCSRKMTAEVTLLGVLLAMLAVVRYLSQTVICLDDISGQCRDPRTRASLLAKDQPALRPRRVRLESPGT